MINPEIAPDRACNRPSWRAALTFAAVVISALALTACAHSSDSDSGSDALACNRYGFVPGTALYEQCMRNLKAIYPQRADRPPS